MVSKAYSGKKLWILALIAFLIVSATASAFSFSDLFSLFGIGAMADAPIHHTVYLVSPLNNSYTNQNNDTLQFVYNHTGSLTGVVNCTLLLDDVEVNYTAAVAADTNTAVLSNQTISEGAHNWWVNCTNGTASESSLDVGWNFTFTKSPMCSNGTYYWNTTGGYNITAQMECINATIYYSVDVYVKNGANWTCNNCTLISNQTASFEDEIHWTSGSYTHYNKTVFTYTGSFGSKQHVSEAGSRIIFHNSVSPATDSFYYMDGDIDVVNSTFKYTFQYQGGLGKTLTISNSNMTIFGDWYSKGTINMTAPASNLNWVVLRGDNSSIYGYANITDTGGAWIATATTTRHYPICIYNDTLNSTNVGSGKYVAIYYNGTKLSNSTTDSNGCIEVSREFAQSTYNKTHSIIACGSERQANLNFFTNTMQKDNSGSVKGIIYSNITDCGINHAPFIDNASVSPANGTANIESTNITLSASFGDWDGNMMNITFYDADTNFVICEKTEIADGGNTSCVWAVNYSTSYRWRINVSDGTNITQSDIYNFSTSEYPTYVSFDVKGYWVSAGKIEIYLNDTLKSTINPTDFTNDNYRAPTNLPENVSKSLGVVNTSNNYVVKIRVINTNAGTALWVRLTNIHVKKNGEYLRSANWTITKTNESFIAKNVYGRQQTLTVVKNVYDSIPTNNYVEYSSQILAQYPELSITPSGIIFGPENPQNKSSTINISATVFNIGSANASNVSLDLYVDGIKMNSSQDFSLAKGKNKTVILYENYAYLDGAKKIDVRINSTNDSIPDNNNAVRYITPNHPYMVVNNFTESPLYVYQSISPYSGLKTALKSTCDLQLNVNLTNNTLKARYATYFTACADLYTNQTYRDKAKEILLTANDEFSNVGWSCGGVMDYYYNVEYLQEYFLAFDMLRGYLNSTEYELIEDRLVEQALDIKEFRDNYFVGAGGYEGIPRTRGNCTIVGDTNNAGYLANGVSMTASIGLMGYTGTKIDELDPYNFARDSFRNEFVEDMNGDSQPQARINSEAGGFQYQGGYRLQTIAYLANGLAVYGKFFGPAEFQGNALAKGVLLQPVYHITPIWTEPAGKGESSGHATYGEMWLLTDLFSGLERKNVAWYAAEVLNKTPTLARAEITQSTHFTKGLFWNYSESYTLPLWNGSYTYVEENNLNPIVIFRSGPGHYDKWMKVYGINESSAANAETTRTYQGAYTIWSDRAYLVVERADERGWVNTTAENEQEGGMGFSSFIFNNTLVPSRHETYSPLTNPAELVRHYTSSQIDYSKHRITLSKFRDLSTDTESIKPAINWNRTVLFPKDYFIVLDSLASTSPYDFDMTIHYGGTEADTSEVTNTDDPADRNLPVKGELNIGNESVSWYGGWNQTNETVTIETNTINWTTESVKRVYINPLWGTNDNVSIRTYIAPSTNITNDRTGHQTGELSNNSRDHMWHPYIKSRQVGNNVKYITIHDTFNTTLGSIKNVTTVSVSGGSGNDYAVKVVNSTFIDRITNTDGEYITFDSSYGSNAEQSYSRGYANGTLQSIFMISGSNYTFNGITYLDATKRLTYLHANVTSGNWTINAEGFNETNLTVYATCNGATTILRQSILQTKDVDWGCSGASFVWINMTFDSPTTYDILGSMESDTMPPSITFVSPKWLNNSQRPENWAYVNITLNEQGNVSLLEWNNGTLANYTMHGSGTNFYINMTDQNGTITYKVYANDTAGNMNVSETMTVTLNYTSANTLTACQDLTIAGGSYILVQNVTSNGTCFNILANNIILDGAGFMVNYSQEVTGYAINNTGGYDNITIKNLNIVQGNSSVSAAHAIEAYGMANSLIENNAITTSG
ncbi:hypothetical protein L6303_03810, partial [archaeon]|nr:hypothetical protein [Nanoarchaeota archaeon]MBU4452319.1 hypothetical protein [Nanoarchaeota archaeon]MCG2723845.1 hypothetical protein [archaeon]